MEEPEQYYTTTEVAKLFVVRPRTVQQWIKNGKLRAIKINGFWRVAKSEVVRLGKETYQ